MTALADSVAFGIHIPHFGRIASAAFMAKAAVRSEELGFSSLWVSDHVFVPVDLQTPYPYREDGVIGLDPSEPFCDPFALIPWLAALTHRVELGIGAFVAPYRRPLVTAKLIGTSDLLSGGRTRMVAGAGWMTEEFEALGVPFAERGRITDETLDLLTASFDANPLQLDGGPVGMEPRPLRDPYPLMVGGHSKPAMRRALRLGHGWQGTPQRAGQVGELVAVLAELAGGEIPDGFIVATRLHISRFDPDDDGAKVIAEIQKAIAPRVDEVILSIVDVDERRYFARLDALARWLGLTPADATGRSE